MKTLYNSPSAELLSLAKEDILLSSLLELLDNTAKDGFAIPGSGDN